LTHEIPVTGIEMAEIENDTVALGNRSFIKGLGPYQLE
jgi:hypothetical protein